MSMDSFQKVLFPKHGYLLLKKILTIDIMVPTGSDESKLRTFQGPSQDQISGYKDFYGEFHNADI